MKAFQMFLSALAFSLLTLQAQAAISIAELEQGKLDVELIERSSQNYIQARGLFKQPVDKVWAALTDFKNYPRYFKSAVKSEVRASKGNQHVVYVEFDFPFPVNKVWVVNRYTVDNARKRLSWTMLDGNLKDSSGAGSWSLQPHKGGTLASYRLDVNKGGAKQWLQKQAVFRSVPSVFSYLERQIR